MQTITGKRHFASRRFQTVRELLNYCAEAYAGQPAYRYHDKPGGQEIVRSFRQFADDINAFGTGLHQLGLAGSHIAIIGRNCYEWAVSHSGIINGTGVSVPLDRQLPTGEVVHLCRRGDVKALIYHGQMHAAALAVAEDNPEIKWFICINDGEKSRHLTPGDARFVRFEDVLSQGRKALEDGNICFVEAVIDPEAMSSIVFTSGTGALSKGVMLCHRNITHNVHSVMGTLNVQNGHNALSILPLHHTFENTVGMYMVLSFGCCICFSDGIRYFNQNLKAWHINILLGVPLVFESLHGQIIKKLKQNRRLFLTRLLLHVCRMLRSLGLDLRRKIFRPILDGMGGGMSLIVCGAAAIDKEIVRFFNEIGIDFYCGYGMTESSPVISVSNAQVNCYGSVGPPIAGIEVAVDTNDTHPGAVGEILTRSDSVMLGYYNNPQDTAATISPDGWLRTGDLGRLDRHGCITLTGRIKSMIVLNNGKKAFPEEIETLLDQIPGVLESFVWGEDIGKGAVDICARLVIDRDQLPEESRASTERTVNYMADQLDLVNRQMPPYKEIRNHYLSLRAISRKASAIDRQLEQQLIRQELKSNGLNLRQIKGRWIETGNG